MSEPTPSALLAERLSVEHGGRREEWQVALEASRPDARKARLGINDLLVMAEMVKTPPELKRLVALCGRDPISPLGESHWRKIQACASESPFDLKSWVMALMAVADWAGFHERERGVPAYLDYVACCAEYAAKSGREQELTEMTCRFLEDFGFEG